MGNIIMNKKEVEQVTIFESLVRKEITQKAASEALRLSERQVRTKYKRFKQEGIAGLAHKNRGRPSSRAWPEREKEKVLTIIKTEWHDFGPTFIAEKLEEYHQIKISSETIRKTMIKEGLWSTKNKAQVKRKRRERKRRFGSMVQLDGSRHKWFGNDYPYYTLLVFIDDATSSLLQLKLVESESLESVMGATREYLELYGRPMSFYVDHGGVFKVNLNNPENDKVTQFERALKQLDINLIHAHSPQAKGRVERSHKTHQDRLVKELRLASIKSLKAANAYLEDYRKRHNEKFACAAAEPGDAHRSVDGYMLDDIFCLYSQRIIQNDYTILYKNRFLQLSDTRSIRYKPKDSILVKESFNGNIKLSLRGYPIEYKQIARRPVEFKQPKVYSQKVYKPSAASIAWNSR